jgi:hypothetical protein
VTPWPAGKDVSRDDIKPTKSGGKSGRFAHFGETKLHANSGAVIHTLLLYRMWTASLKTVSRIV